MATIKEIIDQEKPVFDYLNYALRLAAWGIGLVLSFQINKANADPFFHAVNWLAIGPARRSDCLRCCDSAS